MTTEMSTCTSTEVVFNKQYPANNDTYTYLLLPKFYLSLLDEDDDKAVDAIFSSFTMGWSIVYKIKKYKVIEPILFDHMTTKVSPTS